jgi:hypothetical protein
MYQLIRIISRIFRNLIHRAGVIMLGKKEVKNKIDMVVLESRSGESTSVRQMTGVLQIVSYRKTEYPHRELGLALDGAEKSLRDSIKWINEANAIIESQKIDCPKI